MADSKKNDLKPWLRQQWVIPPKEDAAFVANMEDVLAVYARPCDSSLPVVCVDETSKQLIGEAREPPPLRPGSPAKQDAEYERGGVANLFMAFEPGEGRRRVKVAERRTNLEFAEFMKELSDERYASADRIVLVLDNLNTHTSAAFYQAYEPAEARRLTGRFEWYYTPKHGSWTNVAEPELSVLARQCLDRRIPDAAALKREVAAWEEARNAEAVKVEWHFTTAGARVKLKRLYPTIKKQ